ncbi:hypothetical protein SLEP1_g3502 [Rubroshorea leprosula]|uniref:Uncharacterized protein n=1 Tax=Rubroshorea leprosula TaxID=152421 RepID=A0AAV5HRC1_9ROSI|nr:hypothetical protein SLEP1_g3502 [Rubroshorea leprosula]
MDPQATSQSTEEETRSSYESRPKTIPWTNEKHVQFLNSMEAWFVRTMLEDSRRVLHSDRNTPASSDSTVESKLMLERRRKHATTGNCMGTRSTVINDPPERVLSTPSSQPYNSSQDLVVPNQIENRRIVYDERGLAVASTTPVDAFDLYCN